MAIFEVQCVDKQSGAESWSRIAAVDEETARNRVASSAVLTGQVRQVAEVSASSPMERAMELTVHNKHAPRRMPDMFARGVSIVALAIAVVAIILQFQPYLVPRLLDSNASPRPKYDFSTAKGALLAPQQAIAGDDLQAFFRMSAQAEAAQANEFLKTIKVAKEAAFGGASILFVSYDRDGVPTHKIQGFEKNAKTGLWSPKYVSRYDVAKSEPKLAAMMEKWEETGEFK